MKTYELPKGASVRGISVDDIPIVLIFHYMDGAFGLLTMYDGTIINIGSQEEFEERDGEYWIA